MAATTSASATVACHAISSAKQRVIHSRFSVAAPQRVCCYSVVQLRQPFSEKARATLQTRKKTVTLLVNSNLIYPASACNMSSDSLWPPSRVEQCLSHSSMLQARDRQAGRRGARACAWASLAVSGASSSSSLRSPWSPVPLLVCPILLAACDH